MRKRDDRKDFQDSIVWSDEVTNKLSGAINRHNCVHWTNENPHMVEEKAVNVPSVFQGNNWTVLLQRNCLSSDLPENVESHDSNWNFEHILA